jgi:lipopolysaccharide transport system ATP-binding protein
MSGVIIKVEELGKRYRLGEIGTGTLSHDLNRWWARLRGKDDPFAKIGEANDRTTKGSSEYVWSLKEVSFEVKQGVVLGIIGRNGAGKSTLLKILSKVTAPTTGRVKVKGRIASLLEVGTGFHPELTGRENIFLNGSILGMTKVEIRSRFDEIVDFSGVERYIDTPVKRYSSGMYVRLAFAVAAHLEPDVLIIDEVLAVGDADFQKKCLGKMREVSHSQGRTILFVSHNMQAINSLCNEGLWLHQGQVKAIGEAAAIVNNYLIDNKQLHPKRSWTIPTEAPGNDKIRFKEVELIPKLTQPDAPLDIRTPLTIKFQFWNFTEDIDINTHLTLFSYTGECVFDVATLPIRCQKGVVSGECTIPGNFLNDGSFYISLYVLKDTTTNLFDYEECLSFDLEDYRTGTQWYGKWWGVVRPLLPFRLTQTDTLSALSL